MTALMYVMCYLRAIRGYPEAPPRLRSRAPTRGRETTDRRKAENRKQKAEMGKGEEKPRATEQSPDRLQAPTALNQP